MNSYRAMLAAVAMGLAGTAQAQLIGPSGGTGLSGEYARASDSPWFALPFTWFYLENFETHVLGTPGVSASSGGMTSVVFGPNIHDSVDFDDGVLDGSGLLGDSYFSGTGRRDHLHLQRRRARRIADPCGHRLDRRCGNHVVRGLQPPRGLARGRQREHREQQFQRRDRRGSFLRRGRSARHLVISHQQQQWRHRGRSPAIRAGRRQRQWRTPIPEPETYALMLAGLGVLGWMRRRQRGQA